VQWPSGGVLRPVFEMFWVQLPPDAIFSILKVVFLKGSSP
jgi:hypothetical protein